MNVLDIILLILFIPAIIRGVRKGFIEQVIGLASLFLSAWLAYLFADKVGAWLGNYINAVSKEVLYIFAFIIIVILTVIILNLLAKILSGVVSTISMGWLNSILGFLFAILNTTLVLGIIFMVFTSFNESHLHLGTSLMDTSIIYRWISTITDALFPYIENFFTQISDGGAQMC